MKDTSTFATGFKSERVSEKETKQQRKKKSKKYESVRVDIDLGCSMQKKSFKNVKMLTINLKRMLTFLRATSLMLKHSINVNSMGQFFVCILIF